MILEETQDDDYKLIALITDVTKAEDRPTQDLSFLESINDSFHFTDPESLPLPPVQPVEKEAPVSAEALLVIMFELFSNTFQINRKKPSRKEIQLAREWIDQYQFSSMQIEGVITFAFREATKTNYKIQNLAGLEQYIEPFWTQSTSKNFPPQFFTEPSGSIDTDQPREARPLFPEIPDGKEQAFQYLIGLSTTEQEYWCQAVRRLLSQKDPQTLKQIPQFNRETQNETLLANAAKYFTDAVLSITHSSQ
ncbi:MAG: hypothetical protein HY774_08635 [Acidobacteria bacterium]|nr:hypothetical protein [Acidobacteriota bacterium]